MPKAVVLGGNGQVGSAAARALLTGGWAVTCTGRAEARFPSDLREAGVRFPPSDRYVANDLRNVLHEGAGVVVDCVAYTADQARMLLPFRDDIGSLVFISTKAVYVDEQGRHSNSLMPPAFSRPITQSQATLMPSDIDYNSPEGYGANKVAAEQVVLESGMAVSVLRPRRRSGSGLCRSGPMRRRSARRSTGWPQRSGQVTRAAYCRHRTTRTSHASSTTAGRTPGFGPLRRGRGRRDDHLGRGAPERRSGVDAPLAGHRARARGQPLPPDR